MKEQCNKILNRVNSKEWLKAAGKRAVRTFFQTMGASLISYFTLSDVSWLSVLSIAGLATLISICNSLGGIPEVKEEFQI